MKSHRADVVPSTEQPACCRDDLANDYVALQRPSDAGAGLRADDRERDLRTICDRAPVGLFGFNAHGSCTFCNQWWRDNTGQSQADALGDGWMQAVHPEDREAFTKRWRDAARNAKRMAEEFRLDGPAACPRNVSILAHRVADAADERVAWVGVVEDLSEARGHAIELEGQAAALRDALNQQDRNARELSEARIAAERGSRAKGEFLAMMSHEIRTPLTGLLGMASLLAETELDTQQADYLRTIASSGDALLAVINDILDFSKIEAGSLNLEVVPFDLRGMVEQSAEILSERAERAGLELHAIVDPSLPAVILGDPARIRQVLLNLFSNAVKFTPAGSIVLRVRPAGLATHTIVFEMRDTGIGMSETTLRRIFSAYVQADDSTARKFGGTGLGLTITRNLVTMMGGDIFADSAEGKGTTMVFTLPMRSLEGWHVPKPQGVVLTVARSALARDAIASRVAFCGATPQGAPGLSAAVALAKSGVLRKEDLRLVLLDELGFDDPKLAIREAVAQVPWMGERLVLLHGHGRVWGPADLRAIRAEAAVLRPMKTETLQRLLDGPAGARRTETSALSSLGVALRAVANGVGDASIEDAAAANANPSLRVLLAEDNPVNQRVAASILKKLGCVVTVAENGAEAVDAAAAQTFDLILLDYHMPVMDGLEAARILSARRGPARKIPPIFALTASVFDEHRRQCLEAGMDGILSKPIHVRALRDCVDSAIELRDRVSLEADPV